MKRWTALAGLAVLGVSATANAAVSDEEFQQMKDRLDQLEQEQVAGNTAKLEKLSWAERTRVEGDFRYRFQSDDVGNPVDKSRNRNRIRARAAIISSLSPQLQVGFGLATGSDDPVSTNQTLGGGGSSKPVSIDLAYFSWTGLANTNISGGKFKNGFEIVGDSQLQWDSDWRPEGFDVAWNNGTFFAQGLGTYLESDSNKGNSEFAYLLQAGANFKLGPVAMTGGLGYTDVGAKGKACYYTESDGVPTAASQLCFGNEATGAVGSLVYVNDFQVYDVFAEAGFSIADFPVAVFADYIKNDAADQYDTGYLAGVQLGKAKKKGSWELKYYYEELESNATLGLLTNSDFGGGGTNGKGHVVAAAYAPSDQTKLQVTYFMVDRNSDKIATINGGNEISVDTLQVDRKSVV